jgi:hypothetical protein
MDMDKDQEFQEKRDRLISSLMGKTIVAVDASPASYPSHYEIGSMCLTFSDGSKQSFECCGDSGCYECDPEGMNTAWFCI